ncbi:hypothetical protein QUB70_11590 [Microcoleus sp. A003_D6]
MLFLLLGTIVDRAILGKLQNDGGVSAILGDRDLGRKGGRSG